VDRLATFSDAVVAIAITLLALDLPVPDGDSASAFWTSVQDNAGHYGAFMISFLAIAGAWDSHHDLFRYSKSFDSRLRTLNTVWLLMIILTPFAAKMLTTSGQQTLNAQALRFGFYALLQVVESAAMLGMVRHMAARGDMADAPRTVTDGLAWQCYVLMIGFGVSIPLLFATPDAWVVWFLAPLVLGQMRRARRMAKQAKREQPAGQATPVFRSVWKRRKSR
jgi:uncharacterized membrane protein